MERFSSTVPESVFPIWGKHWDKILPRHALDMHEDLKGKGCSGNTYKVDLFGDVSTKLEKNTVKEDSFGFKQS